MKTETKNMTMDQAKQNLYFEYKGDKRIWIETGAAMGDGIQCAVNANFDKVYSIELSKDLYDICDDLFENNEKVKLFNGDSLEVLPKLLEDMAEPFVLMLDAHWSGGPYIGEKQYTFLPKEISSIIKHSEKFSDSTIIVDDMSEFINDTDWCDSIYDLVLKVKPNATKEDYIFPNGHIMWVFV
jgi:hypothetical protein